MADTDDGSIADAAALLRRIRPEQVVDDFNTGQRRPSSAAFKDPSMSVDVEPILESNGLDWHFSLQGYEGYSLARLQAHHARGKSLAVIHKPLTDNPAHAEVVGRKTQGTARYLAASSTWAHLEPKT
jgi:hypothetical protein